MLKQLNLEKTWIVGTEFDHFVEYISSGDRFSSLTSLLFFRQTKTVRYQRAVWIEKLSWSNSSEEIAKDSNFTVQVNNYNFHLKLYLSNAQLNPSVHKVCFDFSRKERYSRAPICKTNIRRKEDLFLERRIVKVPFQCNRVNTKSMLLEVLSQERITNTHIERRRKDTVSKKNLKIPCALMGWYVRIIFSVERICVCRNEIVRQCMYL